MNVRNNKLTEMLDSSEGDIYLYYLMSQLELLDLRYTLLYFLPTSVDYAYFLQL